MKYSLLLIMAFSACSTPTLQQRQDNWRKFQTTTKTTCKVGRYDPAMPVDVRSWCSEVTTP